MVRQMSGTLEADFGITGTWEHPQLTGTIEMRDGAASFPALGVRDEQVNGLLRLSGDRINIERLSMRSGQGQAEVGGSVRLEELSRPILDLTINARDFRTIDVRDFLALTATADLKLDGPLYQARMSGSATATRGVLYFADLVTKDIVNLQDTLFREFVDTTLLRRQGLGPEFESRMLDSLRIDSLQVQMGNDFWLRSSEANIQLAGRVFVNKVRDRYRLDGALQTPRGSYRLQLGLGATREFTVTRGEVRYFGTPDLNADLDIDARHVVRTVRREDVTVSVHIGGTLYEPELDLSSDIRPPISQAEIISYLLVGAPSFQAGVGASGFETRLVSQTVLGALSSQAEYALISDLGVPIDYLQLRPAAGAGEVPGVEIAAGKQLEVLGKTAFLTLSPRVCSQDLSPSGIYKNLGASLEFSLSRRWLISASVDPVRSCGVLTTPIGGIYQFGVDVFWETSY
jgi:translocation and assembly module TamB